MNRSRNPKANRNSRRGLLFAALAAAPLLMAQAGGPGPKARAPEPVKDVGAVEKGEKISHDFVIRNEGGATLKITEVKPSCGCTVADYPRTIEPGASGTIRSVVETKDFKGPIAKSVAVFTNDPDNPRINLTVKANVKSLVEVSPGYARFIVVQGEKHDVVEQTLWAAEKPDLTVLGVDSPYPFLKVSHRLVESGEGGEGGEKKKKGNEWRIAMALAAEAPVGPMADFVTVRTDHPRQKQVKIPVSGFVRPTLAVVPQVFDFGAREIAEPYPAKIEVKVLGTDDVELGEIATDVQGLEARVEPLEEGRLYNLLITLRPEMKKGKTSGTLTVQTSSPRQPVLDIRVTGTVL